jgi:hypothetical protein
MDSTRGASVSLVALVSVGVLLCAAATPVFAQAEIPAGSTITQADFSVMALSSTGEIVNVHRVTADWGEYSVTWNSFGSSFDPAVIGWFYTNQGWNTVDVTALVQAWVDGVVPNFGVLLRQDGEPGVQYWSSEFEFYYERPMLEIWWMDPAGNPGHALIQRPDAAQDGVADTYVWQQMPNNNFGGGRTLYTGLVNGFEKLSLIRFIITVTQQGPGTGTPGYWKNHPEAWPTETITIGGVQYSKPDAIAEMDRPTRGDKTRTMFRALVATKLNIMIGNDPSCILDSVVAADAWMVEHPLGSRVKGNSPAWTVGEPIKDMLDDYNNGLLCAPHRD